MPLHRTDHPPRSPLRRAAKAEQKREKKKRREEEQEPELPPTAAAPDELHLKEASVRSSVPLMKLTKYERVQVLGSRAADLAAGADPLLPMTGVLDPLVIAKEELDRGLLNSKVVRTFPSGEQAVYPLQALL